MKKWGALLCPAVVLAIGCIVPIPANALIYAGGGYYCNRTAGYVDGYFDHWEWTDCMYDPGSGGGGGAPPTSPPQGPPICTNIKRDRPNDCLNRISMPQSGEYGATQYNLSSALGRAMGLRNVLKPYRTIDPDYPSQINAALRAQTRSIATLTKQELDVDQIFLNSIKVVCASVNRHYNVLRDAGGLFAPDPITEKEWACYNTEVQISREMHSNSIVQMIVTAITNLTGFDAASLIPYSLIPAADPDNSLHKKFNLVTKDAKCAGWWQDMDANGCIAP